MTMITPERTASAANCLLEPMANISLSRSASDCSDMLEEKKSADSGDFVTFKEEIAVEKQMIDAKHQVWRNIVCNAPGSKFLPEKGRYVLYVSRACPESHRALLVRTMKGLEEVVAVKYVHPEPGNNLQRNWIISHEIPEDSLASLKSEEGEFNNIQDIYKNENDFVSNTIPLLYDQEHHCIVSNDANDIASMLNSSFNGLCKYPQVELFPQLPNQHELQNWLYPLLQLKPSNLPPYYYTVSANELEYAFHHATSILQKQRYLQSHSVITEADLRLFVALVRYDAVYSKYLECPPQLLHNPALLDYCREIYQLPGVAATVRMDEILAHFFGGRHAPSSKHGALLELLQVPHQRHLL